MARSTPPITGCDRTEQSEQELASTREHLQATIEELETSNEEPKSANEELQSVNEEVQSTLRLYDFAPTAYFTIDEKSTIIEVNLTAATWLDRSQLIHHDDQDAWYLHRKHLLETGDRRPILHRVHTLMFTQTPIRPGGEPWCHSFASKTILYPCASLFCACMWFGEGYRKIFR